MQSSFNGSLCTTTCGFTFGSTVTAGDFIIVNTFCMLGNSAPSLTSIADTPGDTYIQILVNGRTEIWYAIVKTTTPTWTITVTFINCSGAPGAAGAISVEEYSGVASIGNFGSKIDCPNLDGCTSTITLTVGTNNALVVDELNVLGDATGCPSVTAGSSQILDRTLTCLGANPFSQGQTFYAPNRGIGLNSFSLTTNRNGAGSGTVHAVVELDPPGGSPGNVGTQTACYGNCGNPAVTLANTNSTHTVSFNQSLSLLYVFQSQLNGQVLNVTTNVAKTYSNGQTLTLGIYTVLVCSPGAPAFTSACPGNLQTMISIRNPSKGSQSLTNQAVPVSAGTWVGIGITGLFNGLDVNDTNTQVAMVQTAGAMPPTITQTTNFSPTSKVGLWAYIVGNTITSPGPPVTSVACQNNFAQLDCMLPALSNGLCSVVTASCQTSSSLLWVLILTFLSFLLVTVGFASAHVTKFIAAGDVFIFFFLTWFFIFVGVGLILTFVTIFFLFLGATVFSRTARNYF